MNRRHTASLVLTLLLAAPASAAFAQAAGGEPLGRLFFTPERRAALDRQRRLNIQEAEQTEDPTVTVTGVVKRSSGPNTAWINGATRTTDAPGSLWSGRLSGPAASVRLTPPGEAARQLKVGETLHRGSGNIASPLQGGSVVVHGAKTARQSAQRR